MTSEALFDTSLVHLQLDALTLQVKTRMLEASPTLSGAMGGAEIDFMTKDELALRHALILKLPSAGYERAKAAERIRDRIAERRARAVTRHGAK